MQGEHYTHCCDFFGYFEQNAFDKETDDGVKWQGFVCNSAGELELVGEFVYDRDANGEQLMSGWGDCWAEY